MLEVGDAPADLGAGVALGGERHDDVVVDLGEGGAVVGVERGAGLVGVLDHAVGAGSEVFEPAEERGAEVEAHAGVVVDDADDLALLVDDAGGAVGGVALGGDALVPVVVGSGGVLELDGFKPGVLARRLVEVAVDAEVTLRWERLRSLTCVLLTSSTKDSKGAKLGERGLGFCGWGVADDVEGAGCGEASQRE